MGHNGILSAVNQVMFNNIQVTILPAKPRVKLGNNVVVTIRHLSGAKTGKEQSVLLSLLTMEDSYRKKIRQKALKEEKGKYKSRCRRRRPAFPSWTPVNFGIPA